MTVTLPIDEIIEHGIVFYLFSEAQMEDIRGEVRALFAALHDPYKPASRKRARPWTIQPCAMS